MFTVQQLHYFPLKRQATLMHLVETVTVRETNAGVCVWPSSQVQSSNAEAPLAHIARGSFIREAVRVLHVLILFPTNQKADVLHSSLSALSNLRTSFQRFTSEYFCLLRKGIALKIVLGVEKL
jgi:hypothetical protein